MVRRDNEIQDAAANNHLSPVCISALPICKLPLESSSFPFYEQALFLIYILSLKVGREQRGWSHPKLHSAQRFVSASNIGRRLGPTPSFAHRRVVKALRCGMMRISVRSMRCLIAISAEQRLDSLCCVWAAITTLLVGYVFVDLVFALLLILDRSS